MRRNLLISGCLVSAAALVVLLVTCCVRHRERGVRLLRLLLQERMLLAGSVAVQLGDLVVDVFAYRDVLAGGDEYERYGRAEGACMRMHALCVCMRMHVNAYVSVGADACCILHVHGQ